MITQSVPGSMGGDWRDATLALTGQFVGGGLLFRHVPHDLARERYFAFFANGKLSGRDYFAPVSGNIEDALTVDASQPVALLALEVGNAATFAPDFVPAAVARFLEANSAGKLWLNWNGSSYTLTPVDGDAQLSAISIVGAARGVNVADVPDLPQRGRLSYSLQSVGGNYVLRWWKLNPDVGGNPNPELVAEGMRAGNGAVVCAPMNNSGLTVNAMITYTADVAPGTAWIDLRWMAAYQVHFLAGAALSFPRTPDFVQGDTGAAKYTFVQAAPPGVYNVAVLGVDDEGQVEALAAWSAATAYAVGDLVLYGGTVYQCVATRSATATAPSADMAHWLAWTVTLLAVPVAMQITSVTIAGSVPTVNWAVTQTGYTYTVYSSDVNKPVNWGQRTNPAPVTTAMNASSAACPAFGSPTAVDNTADYATVATAIGTAVAALNTAFATDETTFTAALPTQTAAILAAIVAYAAAIGKTLRGAQSVARDSATALTLALARYTGLSLAGADWTTALLLDYGNYLAVLSQLLDGSAGHFALPDGALPIGGVITGNAGTLFDAGQPFLKPAYLRFAVRATLAGVQEQNDQVYTVELSGAGAVQGTRPNFANIQAIQLAGAVLTVTALVIEDNAAVLATQVELLIDGVVSVVGDLPDVGADGTHAFDLITDGAIGVGWHVIAVRAKSAAGVVSSGFAEMSIYVAGDTPGPVGGFTFQAQRGR